MVEKQTSLEDLVVADVLDDLGCCVRDRVGCGLGLSSEENRVVARGPSAGGRAEERADERWRVHGGGEQSRGQVTFSRPRMSRDGLLKHLQSDGSAQFQGHQFL